MKLEIEVTPNIGETILDMIDIYSHVLAANSADKLSNSLSALRKRALMSSREDYDSLITFTEYLVDQLEASESKSPNPVL